MNLSFFNTNKDKAVKNIKIFLTADEKTDNESNSGGGNVFTPVNSSNTFYIDSIPLREEWKKKHHHVYRARCSSKDLYYNC